LSVLILAGLWGIRRGLPASSGQPALARVAVKNWLA